MKTILLGTDIETTCLGFGCGRLFRVGNSDRRQRILESAFDAGINHFDVAPIYGLGLAEQELGRFAENKRNRIVIATKFGIEPNAVTTRFAKYQQLGRTAGKYLPALRRVLGRKAGSLYRPKQFSVANAKRSLDKSLGALRTDHIDLFLLHEPTIDDVIDIDLAEWLQQMQQKGTIRAYGMAGPFSEIAATAQRYPSLARLVQIPNDILNRNIERYDSAKNKALIGYAPFSTALEPFRVRFQHNATLSQRCTELLGVDVTDTETLSEVLLNYGVWSNVHGVTLFSTSQCERITRLALSSTKMQITDTQMREFLAEIEAQPAA